MKKINLALLVTSLLIISSWSFSSVFAASFGTGPSNDSARIQHPADDNTDTPHFYVSSYWGDPNTGKLCDPNTVPLCVRFYDAHGIPCNPLLNKPRGYCSQEGCQSPQLTGQCKPDIIPTAQEAQDEFEINQLKKTSGGNPFLMGLKIWFISPRLAIKSLSGITELSKMELAGPFFLIFWLTIILVPICLLAIVVILYRRWRKRR